VAALAASALTLPLAIPAAAHETGHRAPTIHVLSSDYVFPLQFAVAGGKVYVADSATSTLTVLGGGSPIAAGPPAGDLAGVAVHRGGRPTIAYTSTDFSTGAATLTILRHRHAPVTADLSGFERTRNPDGAVHYGVDNPSQCVIDAFGSSPDAPPASYPGQVDSHPYAVAAAAGPSWWVADAGGNDILRVDGRGRVSLVAVLPRQPTVITAQMAASAGLPACVVGVTYNFEPVPTDVETGPDGMLYVSTLPGGPEDESFGARGSVYRVNPRTGHATRVATGFAGATNLAVAPNGRIYVAELFAGRISVVAGRTVRPLVDLPNAAAVEYADGSLYASTMAPTDQNGAPTGPGTIVRIDF
jgi:hypothetical protein